jgi:hypothetical protein
MGVSRPPERVWPFFEMLSGMSKGEFDSHSLVEGWCGGRLVQFQLIEVMKITNSGEQ